MFTGWSSCLRACSDNGSWDRPGGHGRKSSFSCRRLNGYTSKKRAGSFPRWFYLTSPSWSSQNQCHLWAEPGRGEGLTLLSTPRSPHSVSWVNGYRVHRLDMRARDWWP